MWFDPAAVEAVRDALPTWLAVAMVVLSYLGSVYVIAPAAVAAYWRRRDLVAPWLGAVVGCYALMSITKSVHSASRPTVDPPVGPGPFPEWFVPWYEHAAHIDTASFPSGHAMAATIVVGVIVLDLPVSTLAKRAVAGAAVVGWVGFTRIGLAVHYPGDVAGGIAYGLGFLALYYLARHRVPGWFATRVVGRRLGGRRVAGRGIDGATAAFALALVFAAGAVLVSGTRNAHVVFGAGLGGLFAWYHAPAVAAIVRDSVLETALPVIAAAAVVGTWFVTDLGIGNGAFTVGWSALFLAMVVWVPWVGGERESFETPVRAPQAGD